MPFSKYDEVNRYREARIDRFSGKKTRKQSIIIDGKRKSVDVLDIGTVISNNIEDLNKHLSSASGDIQKSIDSSIRRALSNATAELLPMGEEQFSKGFAKKKRNSPNKFANSSWNVGYNTGDTLKAMMRHVSKSSRRDLYSIKDKVVKIAYTIPAPVAMKLNPKNVTAFSKLANISAIERWVATKGINKKWSHKASSKSIAFAIAKSWTKTWKPVIMDENALKIGRNSSAIRAFNKSIANSMDNIKTSIVNDLFRKLQ